ncbi:unnamed protein product [Calicophoron daubneyi]|uniref:NADH dehydrogenase [ubiquinone] 1 beta subcomplex subunit 10 n=1 Tax=Calicophoron daubneyi TaxID=300641 RepID=A0AAV2TJ06_CALDB
MAHEEKEHELTREDLMKPLQPSLIEKYIFPIFVGLIDTPVTFFREQVVERVRTPYPYYHERYQRVPTIEQCRLDDSVCLEEANAQFKRDRLVDMNIVHILKRRRDECELWYRHEQEDIDRFCKDIVADHEQAATNYFIKYGDLSWNTDVRHAFMKQKHRMIWEQRNGPIPVVDKKAAAAAAEKALEESMIDKLRRAFGSAGLPKEMRR